ncbi:hypothetical protein REPUB_Repub04eG0159300 [Reevesia pubescens]
MQQKNGQWGAQLYANHARIWLRTFKSEKNAAMAYDSAAIMFCTGDTHRNFPWTEITVEEPKFQCHYSTEAVLSMIRMFLTNTSLWILSRLVVLDMQK